MTTVFRGNFTQQEPIPEPGIERAVEVMRTGRLHRYNTAPGETSETALLECEFRDYVGARYCLAVASGGYALTTALRACGVGGGMPVLTNGFTLAPVPGAIAAAGARALLVEIDDDLRIDLDDLRRKISASGSRVLLLSHMRGHIPDMDAVVALCGEHGLTLIEDCAHTMGAAWNGVKSGRHGTVACYSTQTYKHLNSGEGGLLVADDPQVMARATVLSGSYMLYGRHPAGPPAADYADIRLDTPNCSGRMDNLRAAVLRPQLAVLDDRCARWNQRYEAVAAVIGDAPGIVLPRRLPREQFVASSIQFRLPGFDAARMQGFLARCLDRGVEIKWFGAREPVAYTSTHHDWRYVAAQPLPQTDRVLATLCDMRLPLTFSLADCRLIGTIIRESAAAAAEDAAAPAPAGLREVS
jgi:dTDP-4-amino-4,6-dideoxygalactose transaminase